MKREATYSGVVVSFERGDEGELLVYVYGEINGEETYFYVKPKSGEVEGILRLGVGQRIEGKGVVVSENPLIVSVSE